jgi:hypothetical protein
LGAVKPDPEHSDTPHLPEEDPAPIAPVGRPWVGRDDMGDDGLCRWERDDLARYANTGDTGFLLGLLDEGSPVARHRAARLIEARPHATEPSPLPPPAPDFRTRAAALVAALRKGRVAHR